MIDLDLYREALDTTTDADDIDALLLALADELEESWEGWLRYLFPAHVTYGFAAHHRRFWEWVWSIEPAVRAQPFIGIWGRGGAKSTSAELAVVALGARKRRRYVLYVCHAKGTEVLADGRWMRVEEHPSAEPRLVERTLRVRVAGLPEREVVSPEHRYWARRVARRDHGHGRPSEIRRTRPTWVEADDLDWNTWLGLPIDATVIERDVEFDRWNPARRCYEPDTPDWTHDVEFWWAVGLWWGDGTLGGARRQQISWSTADAHPAIRDRLIAALTSFGLNPQIHRRGVHACADVAACHAGWSRWLADWKQGRNRKLPPAWVERLSLDAQAALMRGYFDADGSVSARSADLVSIHLPGLMAARRVLARLGIPAAISQTRPEGTTEFRGTTYVTQTTYRLSIREGASALGIDVAPHSENVRDLWIDDGYLWSRVRDVDENGAELVVPIQTDTGDYVTAFARSHNCDSQDQADDHVTNIGTLLESTRVGELYPEMGERLLGKFGNSRGWRRNRLRTASGFTVDAIGLDSAARGAKLDEDRPDLIVFDDLDDGTDSPKVTQRKIDDLTRKILPAQAEHATILGIQNLVAEDGIFGRIAGRGEQPADFLQDRILSGPIPAVENLHLGKDDAGRDVVLGGDPVWEGQNLERVRLQILDWGLTAFRIEAQHEVELRSGGKFSAWDWMEGRWLHDPMPQTATRCRAWDQAGTEFDGHNDPDWTASVLWAYDPETSLYRIEDVIAFRHSADQRDQIMRTTATEDAERHGRDGVTQIVEKRPGDLGRDEADRIVREVFQGFRAEEVAPIGTKEQRADGLASAMGQGLITIIEQQPEPDAHRRGTRSFLGELEGFPLGPHDDQVDAAAHGFNWIRKRGGARSGTSSAAGAAAGSVRR